MVFSFSFGRLAMSTKNPMFSGIFSTSGKDKKVTTVHGFHAGTNTRNQRWGSDPKGVIIKYEPSLQNSI